MRILMLHNGIKIHVTIYIMYANFYNLQEESNDVLEINLKTLRRCTTTFNFSVQVGNTTLIYFTNSNN
ncbi:hypothetical protein SLEP1_g14574 [Rubroshorea leprosula]|uniref:Uncharacterized protein n=1 Tax=Rubroshorea leprosula TaxID=152421 RepID=A0AAV5IV29_9ROSI|nr:hypothetical protein SLEP1_g14574 [Rubroshorea leprosula]